MTIARSVLAVLVLLSTSWAHGASGQQPPNENGSLADWPASGAEVSAEGAWWAFQQRAYPTADMPEGAQMRALRQTRTARSSTGGGAAGGDDDRWVTMGPAPIADSWFGRPVSGRVASVAVDPGDDAHWLIGSAQGGVWETRDGGTTWTPKTDEQASLAIGVVTFAPSDPRIIYAGTGEAHFIRTGYA